MTTSTPCIEIKIEKKIIMTKVTYSRPFSLGWWNGEMPKGVSNTGALTALHAPSARTTALTAWHAPSARSIADMCPLWDLCQEVCNYLFQIQQLINVSNNPPNGERQKEWCMLNQSSWIDDSTSRFVIDKYCHYWVFGKFLANEFTEDKILQ